MITFFVDICAAAGGDGSEQKPFRSPVEACAALRSVVRDEPATVKLAPGIYELPDGLVLGAHDKKIVFQGEKGVRLTRSVTVAPDGKVPCDAPPPPPAEGYFKMSPHAPMFFYDHRWAQCARWPKNEWAYFTEAVDNGLRSRMISGIEPDAPTSAGSFRFDSDRPAKWDFSKGIYLAGYWTHDWSFEYLLADSFDAENHVMKLAGASRYGIACGTWSHEKGRRFYAYNVREELSEPGEYYYDRETQTVAFIPPASGVTEFRAAVTEGPVVSATGAADIVFDGIDFEYAAGDGISLVDSSDIIIRNCRILNVGGNGASITGGARCEIRNTRIAGCGFGGVVLNGGDRKTLTRGDHVVSGCVISGFGRICRTYAPGARVLGVGNTLRGNEFFDAPHSAVIYGGNDHLFEGNDVHDIMRETGDAGAFYTGRDPTSRGNVLKGNFVHDIGRPSDPASNTMAFYIDDCDAGETLVGNHVKNVARGLMLGGGHDNHIIGNVFENCRIGMSIDARGVAWDNRWDSPTDSSWQMTRKVREMNVAEEPWRSHYPLLATYLEDHPREPRHISVTDNRFIDCVQSIRYEMGAEKYKDFNDIRGNVSEANDPIGKLRLQAEVEPRVFDSGYPEADGVKSLFFEGPAYKGKNTRVFAYLALPETKPGEKVPGIVLVHGGLGSASRRWAGFWRDQGYAAISMDTCGCVSGDEFGDETGHVHQEDGGPQGWGNFALADDPPEDQWPFHAVSAVMRATSVLRSLPGVDPARIGITGISWGGWLTCLCAGLDSRYAFAAPVYGCGYIDEDSVWKDNGLGGATEEQWRKWHALWEPRHHLPFARCPFLWIDGSNDFVYPLSSLQKSVETLSTSYYRTVILRMPHSHTVAEHPRELVDFAAAMLKGGPAYPYCKEAKAAGGVVSAVFEPGGYGLIRAELEYTTDGGHWQEREWKTVAADWDVSASRATATLPEGVTAWYVSAFTEDGKTISSDLNAYLEP